MWAQNHSHHEKKKEGESTQPCMLRRVKSIIMNHKNSGVISLLEKYSAPLLVGIVLGLVWYNIFPESFSALWNYVIIPIPGHDITPKFIVNDVFMAFFFAQAGVEIKQAFLPGGDLYIAPDSGVSGYKKLGNILFSTIGGIMGPIVVFFIVLSVFSSSFASDVSHGWAIPTATDIVVALLIARFIFGGKHTAIIFLTILAVLDDAIGMGIIAIFYSHGFSFSAFGIGLAAIIVAYVLSRKKVMNILPYFLLGVVVWVSFFFAGLHPALAFVPIVLLMPAAPLETSRGHIYEVDHEHKPDTLFSVMEHALESPITWGLFFFGVANMGIDLGNGIAPLSYLILGSLLVGKFVGIVGGSVLASSLGMKRSKDISLLGISIIGLLGAIGLTVSIFVSDLAYKDLALVSQAKMGALLSPVAVLVLILPLVFLYKRKKT